MASKYVYILQEILVQDDECSILNAEHPIGIFTNKKLAKQAKRNIDAEVTNEDPECPEKICIIVRVKTNTICIIP